MLIQQRKLPRSEVSNLLDADKVLMFPSGLHDDSLDSLLYASQVLSQLASSINELGLEVHLKSLQNLTDEYNLFRTQTVPALIPETLFPISSVLAARTARSSYDEYFYKYTYAQFDNEQNVHLGNGSLHEGFTSIPLGFNIAIDHSMKSGLVGYSHSLGVELVREEIALLENSLRQDADVIQAENVAVTLGATSAVNIILKSLKALTKRSRILVVAPGYAPFLDIARGLFEIDYVFLASDTKLDPHTIIEVLSQEHSAVLLINVSNPFGTRIDELQIQKITLEAEKVGSFVVVDDAGLCFVHDEPLSPRLSSFYQNQIRVKSLSKEAGLPGLKCGYVISSKQVLDVFKTEASREYGAPNSVAYTLLHFYAMAEMTCGYLSQNGENGLELYIEKAAARFSSYYSWPAAITHHLFIEYVHWKLKLTIKIFNSRNTAIKWALAQSPCILSQVIIPEGSLNICVKLPNVNSFEFFQELLQESQVSVFPGECFGISVGGWIRVTFTVPEELLNSGLERISNLLKKKYIKNMLYSHPQVEKELQIEGLYDRYRTIDFYPHLFDALAVGKFLLRFWNHQPTVDEKLVEKVILSNDRNKILEVIKLRLKNITEILKTSNVRGRRESFNNFTDHELFGCRQELISNKISFGQLLELERFFHSPEDLILVSPVFSLPQHLQPKFPTSSRYEI